MLNTKNYIIFVLSFFTLQFDNCLCLCFGSVYILIDTPIFII
jgi:hypothetical protein